jgi:hypothetical protein
MFNKYCMRLQNLISTPFDTDFKRFLKDRGIEIEPTLYKLKFTPPQSFTKYREIELQTQQVNLFTQIIQVPFIAKSFAMKKWLDLSEDEMIENEIAWARENPDKIKAAHGQTAGDAEQEGDLADVGIRGSMGGMDMGMDPAMDDLGAETDPAAGTDPAAAAGGDPAAPAPAGGAIGGAPPAGPTGAI